MKVGEKIMGFTFDGEMFVCDKCGEKTRGIIPMSIHWNDCVDGGKTLAALKSIREEKGSELTVEDIEPILPKPNP